MTQTTSSPPQSRSSRPLLQPRAGRPQPLLSSMTTTSSLSSPRPAQCLPPLPPLQSPQPPLLLPLQPRLAVHPRPARCSATTIRSHCRLANRAQQLRPPLPPPLPLRALPPRSRLSHPLLPPPPPRRRPLRPQQRRRAQPRLCSTLTTRSPYRPPLPSLQLPQLRSRSQQRAALCLLTTMIPSRCRQLGRRRKASRQRPSQRRLPPCSMTSSSYCR
jgi:hypothetical protein